MEGWHWERMKCEGFERIILDTQEQVEVHMCGFNGVQRGNYFGGESVRRKEVETSVRKLKIGKDASLWRDDESWR